MSELLNLILHAWLLATVAVCFATVLVGDGMLLAPVQARVREWHFRRWCRMNADADGGMITPNKAGQYYDYQLDLDNRWWWKPLWGCFLCVAGQWAFWGYLLSCIDWHARTFSGYHALHHLYFTALTILFAAGWRAFYVWTQTK